MFKKLQKLSVTAIALVLICSFSIEMLSMASGYCPLFGGTWEREIPIVDELPLPWWQVCGDSNAYDPITGPPSSYFSYYNPDSRNNCQFSGVSEQQCPDGEVNYFDWLKEELQHLSKGIFDKFCNVAAEATVLDFIKKHNLKTPVHFYDNTSLEQFKSMYYGLMQVLQFVEDIKPQDENCFLAENLYFMACELCHYKSNCSPLDWENIEQYYSKFFEDMFKLIPPECLYL